MLPADKLKKVQQVVFENEDEQNYVAEPKITKKKSDRIQKNEQY